MVGKVLPPGLERTRWDTRGWETAPAAQKKKPSDETRGRTGTDRRGEGERETAGSCNPI